MNDFYLPCILFLQLEIVDKRSTRQKGRGAHVQTSTPLPGTSRGGAGRHRQQKHKADDVDDADLDRKLKGISYVAGFFITTSRIAK